MVGNSVGVVAIIIKNRKEAAAQVNNILSQFGNMIIGRMGIPYHKRNLSIITLIVDATTDEIGALTGKLGMIKDVNV